MCSNEKKKKTLHVPLGEYSEIDYTSFRFILHIKLLELRNFFKLPLVIVCNAFSLGSKLDGNWKAKLEMTDICTIK